MELWSLMASRLPLTVNDTDPELRYYPYVLGT